MELKLNAEQEELLKRTREILGRVRDLLADTDALASDRAALVDSMQQLDELFLLVIAGEFNSGKSSFINALLGQNLQKEGVTPTTDKIHLLKYGADTAQAPGDRGVWVRTAPVELLRQISIVDTPGTNAILREHEALTAEFIPRSDLVLFLTSSDRPFTESERSFLDQIKAWGKKIVLVLNKIDMFSSDEELQQVVQFVTESAQRLVGDIPAIFPVSARLAQQAKHGRPEVWATSRFEALERFVTETLDDNGRFRLKLLNPIGVGGKLVGKQLDSVQHDLDSLSEDSSLLDDIQRQMVYYNDDMQRNFRARLGEVDNILFSMEKRGNAFFDERMRIGRIPDLINTSRVQRDFEQEVVGETAREIDARVDELVDWMVEQDLRQWTAVSSHLAKRKAEHVDRVVGEGGPREGTLAYDRQRLIDSIGRATQQAVASYDKQREAAQLASSARQAVVNTGLAGVGVGLGTALALATTAAWLDVTGVLAGVMAATLGLLILPSRRSKAKQELAQKLATLRHKLVTNLTEQFEREMRRGAQRIEDTVAPFARFVRAEEEKLTEQRDVLEELEAHLTGLRRYLEGGEA